MSLFRYDCPVPCYQTADITNYRPELFREATNLFQLAREHVLPGYADNHCIIWEGSFSIIAASTIETSAKIVMHQRGVGHWLGDDPGWGPGVYVWVRANDDSGQEFKMAAQDHSFIHRWVLSRFEPNGAVSVAPNFNEHFYYFRIDAEDDLSRIAQLLAFCSTL